MAKKEVTLPAKETDPPYKEDVDAVVEASKQKEQPEQTDEGESDLDELAEAMAEAYNEAGGEWHKVALLVKGLFETPNFTEHVLNHDHIKQFGLKLNKAQAMELQPHVSRIAQHGLEEPELIEI